MRKLVSDYRAKYPGEALDGGVSAGYPAAAIVGEALKKACEAGDLSREGVLTVHRARGAWDGGYGTEMDFSVVDKPATRATYIVKPDKEAVGGAVIYREAAVSDLAGEYTVPVG